MKSPFLLVVLSVSVIIFSGCQKDDNSNQLMEKSVSPESNYQAVAERQKKENDFIRQNGLQAAGFKEITDLGEIRKVFNFRNTATEDLFRNNVRLFQKGSIFHLIKQEETERRITSSDDFLFYVQSQNCICSGAINGCDPTGNLVDDGCYNGIGGAINWMETDGMTWELDPGATIATYMNWFAFNGGAVVTLTLDQTVGILLRSCILVSSPEMWMAPINESRIGVIQ